MDRGPLYARQRGATPGGSGVKWRDQVLSIWCPYCDQAPGVWCVVASGDNAGKRSVLLHGARNVEMHRLKKAGELPDAPPPAPLNPKMQRQISDMRIALNAINKIGDLKRAKRAFSTALKSLS